MQRRIWEDAFSLELTNHDVAAMPSYRLFPDAVPDTDQVNQAVRSNSFDGVLITGWLPSETKPQYLQGYVTKEQDMGYDRRSERFVTCYRDVEHAGYVDSRKVDMRAIDVWTTRNDGQTIWSARRKDSIIPFDNKGFWGSNVSAFFLALTNPLTIFAFITVFAAFGLGHRLSIISACVLVLGVFAGSGLWFLTLGYVSRIFRKKPDTVGLRWVSRIAGIMIMVAGVAAFASMT